MRSIGKEIKSILLSENGDLTKIKTFIDSDVGLTFTEIFKVLEKEIDSGIISDIETIMLNIENVVLNEENNLDIIRNCNKEAICRIFGNKNTNSLPFLKNIKYRLLYLNRNLYEKEREKEISLSDNKEEETSTEEVVTLSSLEEKYHVSLKINPDVINELDNIKINLCDRERVFGNFITIDDENACCLDDAIDLKPNKDGSYFLDVAITDIPSLIPYGSLLYNEARKRIETHYLCDTTASLYPEVISNNLASLLPHVDRNAIIYRYLVDPSLTIDYDSLKIIKGIINVNNKLTYHEVNNELNMDKETIEMIYKMYQLAMNLRGYSSKDKYRELENIIKKNASYHHSIFANKSMSANIIQETMILVNRTAPEYFNKNGYVYLYRNLIAPTYANINEKVNRLISISKDNIVVGSSEYQNLVEEIKKMYLSAYYSSYNDGHMGLGLDFYSHSTSGARRFADSYNQYLTYSQIFNGPLDDKKYYELEKKTSMLADYINKKKKENAKFESEYNRLCAKGRILKK